MDLLTPSINVPAERAKLRTLRDEIAADVEARKEYQRLYTPRGFLRDVPALETQGQQGHGAASAGPLRPWPGVDVPPTPANVRKAQAGCSGCGRCAYGMAGKGLTQ